MPLWLRAFLLGFVGWILPLLVSFLLFPIRRENAPLFSTIMFLVVLVTAGMLLRLCFHHREIGVAEASLAGTLWLVMGLALDYPLFVYGPMKMTTAGYYSEIGLIYLTFPVFALLTARLHRH